MHNSTDAIAVHVEEMSNSDREMSNSGEETSKSIKEMSNSGGETSNSIKEMSNSGEERVTLLKKRALIDRKVTGVNASAVVAVKIAKSNLISASFVSL